MSEDISKLIEELTSEVRIDSLKDLLDNALNKTAEIVSYSVRESERFSKAKDALDKFYSDFSDSFNFLEESMLRMDLGIDEVKDELNSVFNHLNDHLDDYESMIGNETINLICTKASLSVRNFLAKEYKGNDKIKKINALASNLISLVLPSYLISVKELNDSIRTINDEWYIFVCRNYYGDASDDGSVENKLMNKIILGPLNETGKEWKGELLRSLVLKDDENIIFGGFNEWLSRNYEKLVLDFYKWSENRINYIPTLSGLITASILESLNISKSDLSKSEFINVANDIIEKFKNSNIKSILENNKVDYNKYESLLDSIINHYVAYSKSVGINNDLINKFSSSVTMIFINYCNMCLTNKVKNIESAYDYKIDYARWVQTVEKRLTDEFLAQSESLTDNFYSSITKSKLNEIFNSSIDESSTTVLNRVRSSYGRLKNKIKEVLRRKKDAGLIDEMIAESQVSDLNELADKYIKNKWSEYNG